MHRRLANSSGGFSLIELLVSLAVGTLIVGAAVQLFTKGMNATFVVSQRAEMQQDLADVRRQAQALKTFYAALDADQQRIFDTMTAPSANSDENSEDDGQ